MESPNAPRPALPWRMPVLTSSFDSSGCSPTSGPGEAPEGAPSCALNSLPHPLRPTIISSPSAMRSILAGHSPETQELPGASPGRALHLCRQGLRPPRLPRGPPPADHLGDAVLHLQPGPFHHPQSRWTFPCAASASCFIIWIGMYQHAHCLPVLGIRQRHVWRGRPANGSSPSSGLAEPSGAVSVRKVDSWLVKPLFGSYGMMLVTSVILLVCILLTCRYPYEGPPGRPRVDWRPARGAETRASVQGATLGQARRVSGSCSGVAIFS